MGFYGLYPLVTNIAIETMAQSNLVDLPIEHSDFPVPDVTLPEG